MPSVLFTNIGKIRVEFLALFVMIVLSLMHSAPYRRESKR